MVEDSGFGSTDSGSVWRRVRAIIGLVVTVLACLLVWLALIVPNELSRISLGALVAIPIEGLVLVALVLVLPRRARTVVAAVVGVLLGLVTIVKSLDWVLFVALNRPFNPVIDRGYLTSAERLLTDAVGHQDAVTFLTVASVLGIAVLVLVPLATVRVSGLVSRHRQGSLCAIVALAAAWVVCLGFGLQISAGAPIAARSEADVAYEQAR